MFITAIPEFIKLIDAYGSLKNIHQIYIMAGGDKITLEGFRNRIRTRGTQALIIKNPPKGWANNSKYPEYDKSVPYSTYAKKRQKWYTHEEAIKKTLIYHKTQVKL